MGKDKKQRKAASYSDVAKQQPPKNATRNNQPTNTGDNVPDPEPLINLESDHSSSDEAGNSKNPVPAKRARTVSKDAMDEDFSSPFPQTKTASSSDNSPQSTITPAPQTNLDQPPVDRTSNSGKTPYERPANMDTIHQELAELNKETQDKETDQNSVEDSNKLDINASRHANIDTDVIMNEDNSAAVVANSNCFKAAAPFA